MIKGLIFDFFDVIRTDGFNRWLKSHGYEREGKIAEASLLLDVGEIDTNGFFQLLSESSGQPAQKIQQEMDSNTYLLDGMVDILAELQKHYKLTLLSNSASDYLRKELVKYGLEKYFDLIVISSEVGMAKPQPGIFTYILKQLKLRPNEVLFIDDNPTYIVAARASGIEGIVFTDANKLKIALADKSIL